MLKLVNEIRNNYKVDGENEKYLEYFENYEDVAKQEEGLRISLENSLNNGESFKNLNYPIIFFDDSNSDSGQIYQSDDDEDFILERASEYFDKK